MCFLKGLFAGQGTVLVLFLFPLFVASCKTLSDKKESRIVVQKIWIRETFPKDWTRPSIGQSIKPVLSAQGLLIQGHKSRGLIAYTSDRGKKKWFFPVKGGLAGGVLADGPLLFFGGADGFMYALQAKTGQVVWKHYTGLTTVSRPVQKGQYLYFASPDRLYCLNKKTGKNLWTYSAVSTPGQFIVEGVASPLPGSSLVYFKVSDGSLTALDFRGRLKWKKKLSDTGSDFTSAVSGITMGKVCLYTASLQAGLYCLNPKTGKTIWKTSVGSHGDVLLSGSRLFYPSQDGRVLALDQKSGKLIWSHRVPHSIATSLVLNRDMLVYGEYRGALRFISRQTGEELGHFAFGQGMSVEPAVSALDSALYFISRAGWLYKITSS